MQSRKRAKYQKIVKEWKEATSQRRELLDKNREAKVSLYRIQELEIVEHVLLSWFRDLELLSVGADSSLLRYAHVEDFEGQTEINPYLAEELSKDIQRFRLESERSMRVAPCLEELFLHLQNLQIAFSFL